MACETLRKYRVYNIVYEWFDFQGRYTFLFTRVKI